MVTPEDKAGDFEVVDIEASKDSRSSLRNDPFAVREGKTLTWRNMNMTLVRVSLHKSFSPVNSQDSTFSISITER